jgi:hypothetical protein
MTDDAIFFTGRMSAPGHVDDHRLLVAWLHFGAQLRRDWPRALAVLLCALNMFVFIGCGITRDALFNVTPAH